MLYPPDVYDPETGEIIVDYPNAHASSYTSTIRTSSPTVTFEYVDRYGNTVDSSAIGSLVGENGVTITATGDAKKILEIAASHVGGPYLWGGNDWATGVDCSHYVTKVMTEAGVYHGGYRTSDGWMTVGRKVDSLAQAQAGDVIVYSGHVAIYDGNGMIYEAKGTQWGITHDRKADCSPILAIRRLIPDGATGGAASGGTGSGVSTSGTTYDQSTAAGKTITVPSGLGRYFSYMGWQMITAPSSQQYKLREKAGQKFDSEGFGIIDGRYVIACTTTFGNVGDLVDFYQTDGTVLHTIIGDIKNQNDAGCNQWGHNNGQVVVEFVVDKNTWYGKKANVGTATNHPELGGKYITKAVNLGSWFGGASGGSNLSTSGFGQTEFFKSILSMSAIGGYYDNPSDVEKYNQYCYDILDYSVADWDLRGVRDFNGSILSSRGGVSVEYTTYPTGNQIEWTNSFGGRATAVEYAMNCTVKIQVLADLRYMERADEKIIKNFTGWDWESFNNGDQIPVSYMELEDSVYDNIFNVQMSMSGGGGAMFTGVEKQVYDFLASKGLKAPQIAGLMGNIFCESGFNPAAVNSGSGASGLFQWLGGRLQNLKNYAASKGTQWTDVQTQMEYAWKEIDGLDGWNFNSAARNTFMTTDKAYTAGSTFGHYWERCGSASEDDKRGKKAEYYYSIIISGGGSSIGYVQWALNIAADNSHGYSQSNRNGPDYDCSSLVYYALKNSGFPVETVSSGAWTVASMDGCINRLGFTKFAITSVAQLQPGDILITSDLGHTEIYIGNGQTVGAHQGSTDGLGMYGNGERQGDQTGNEISVSNCGNRFSHAWRLTR